MANAAISKRERERLRKTTLAAPRYPKAGEDAKVVKVAPAKVEDEIDRDGLAWMAKKKRLNVTQLAEAMFYRNNFRDAGELSMKSCLDVVEGGRGAAGAGMYFDGGVVTMTTARRHLLVARFQVLRGQIDMLTVMDGICGLGRTARYLASGDQQRAREMEAILRVALDLLVAHRALEEAVAAAKALNEGG